MAEDRDGVHVPPMLAKRISANVVRLRRERGWSRPDLAERVAPKTSPQQIQRLEKNERSWTAEWIERVAGGLKVSPYALLGSDDLPGELTLEAPVANEVARSFGKVALGEEPTDALVAILATMLTELCETFARHPATRRDPSQVQPVIDLLTKRSATQ